MLCAGGAGRAVVLEFARDLSAHAAAVLLLLIAVLPAHADLCVKRGAAERQRFATGAS